MMKNGAMSFVTGRIAAVLFGGCLVLTFYIVMGMQQPVSAAKICMELFGGTRLGTVAEDYKPFVQWFLTVLPLLILVGLQLSQELSGRLYYVMIRMKTKNRWWNHQFGTGLLFALCYSTGVFITVFLLSLVMSTAPASASDHMLFLNMFILYLLANVMLASLLMALTVFFAKLKLSFVLLMILIFLSYIWGKYFPAANPYLIGSYSMINRSVLFDKEYGFHTLQVAVVSAALAFGSYIIGRYGTKKIFYKLEP